MRLWPWTKRTKVQATSQLLLVRSKFDAAQTTPDNRTHWSNADALAPDAAASPEVRRTLRNRVRYEVDKTVQMARVEFLPDPPRGPGI